MEKLMKIENPQQEIKKPPEEKLGGKFHFEEIAEIEQAMFHLAEQLKDKIERGEYDTLISDDVGGRIPTLILRKIMKKIAPKTHLDTYFVASGKTYFPSPDKKEEYAKLRQFFLTIAQKTKKALVVSQYMHSGETLRRFSWALHEAGIRDFDTAVVRTMPHFREMLSRGTLDKNKVYVGTYEWQRFSEKHERFSGYRKSEKYSPTPERAVDIIPKEGRDFSQEEFREIFGLEKGESREVFWKKIKDPEKIKEYERRMFAPLTSEEIAKIKDDMKFAREDAMLIADRIMEKIWGKKYDR